MLPMWQYSPHELIRLQPGSSRLHYIFLRCAARCLKRTGDELTFRGKTDGVGREVRLLSFDMYRLKCTVKTNSLWSLSNGLHLGTAASEGVLLNYFPIFLKQLITFVGFPNSHKNSCIKVDRNITNWTPGLGGERGRGGRLPCKEVGDARREIWIKPQKETSPGKARAKSNP